MQRFSIQPILNNALLTCVILIKNHQIFRFYRRKSTVVDVPVNRNIFRFQSLSQKKSEGIPTLKEGLFKYLVELLVK